MSTIVDRRHLLRSAAGIAAVLAAPWVARAQGLPPSWPTSRGVEPHLIWVGDSRPRGYALGVFSDQLAPSYPQYTLSSPTLMLRSMLSDNGFDASTTWYFGSFVNGNVFAPSAIAQAASAGIIRPGDIMVFMDAGDHDRNPDAYQAGWLACRAAAPAAHALFLTTPEYPDETNGSWGPFYEYDVVQPSGRTMNQAIRDAAAAAPAPGVANGWTNVLEFNSIQDGWKSAAWSIDGVRVMRSDGIHENVWGQAMLVGEVVKAAGWRSRFRTVPSMIAHARANWDWLGYGSTSSTWSADRAEAYAYHCLLR